MKITIDISEDSMESLIEEANEEKIPLDKYISQRIDLCWEILGESRCIKCCNQNKSKDF